MPYIGPVVYDLMCCTGDAWVFSQHPFLGTGAAARYRLQGSAVWRTHLQTGVHCLRLLLPTGNTVLYNC